MKKISAAQGGRSVTDSYRTVAVASLLGTVVIAAVLLLAAVVISSVDFPQSGIAPVAIVALVLGCWSSGFFCARILKSQGMLYGLVCGTLIFLLCLLCEVFFLGGSFGLLALYKYIICATAAMIGGVLGVSKRRKVR